MESQVPGCVPWKFPFIRHGEDIGVVQMRPVTVASPQTFRGWRRASRIARKPPTDIIVIELLAPKKASESLTLHATSVIAVTSRGQLFVKLVRLLLSFCEDSIERLAEARPTRLLISESQPDRRGLPRSQGQHIVSSGLRADLLRVNRLLRPMNDIVIDAIFHIARPIQPVKPTRVRFIVGEEQLRETVAQQQATSIILMVELNDARVSNSLAPAKLRPNRPKSPGPGVAKPDGGQHG